MDPQYGTFTKTHLTFWMNFGDRVNAEIGECIHLYHACMQTIDNYDVNKKEISLKPVKHFPW
jgi:hypothetical protein